MTKIEKVLDDLRAPILRRVMSKRELARRANLSIGTLYGMERQGWNPTAETIRALQEALARRPLARGANQSRIAA